MKIQCNRESLAKAFSLASSVVPSKAVKAVLGNVKLTADGDRVTLSATDMEIGVCVTMPEGSTIHQAGTVLLPVQRTANLLRESPDANLTIESDETGVVIKGGRSRFRLPSVSADEFPSIDLDIGEKYHEIQGELLREILHRTIFATDQDSSRFALGGINFEMEGEEVIAVATDGRRLATMRGPAVSFNGHRTTGHTIVPAKAAAVIQKSLADQKDEAVHFMSSSGSVTIKTGRTSITSRLVEGRYPNWRQVIPSIEHPIVIDLVVGPFFAALRQAAVVTDQESRGIDFTFSEGTICIQASAAEIGESNIEFACEYSGQPVKVTLDHRYLADFLRVVPIESTAKLHLEAANRPVMLTTEDGYTYVIMPITRDQ